MRSIRPLRTGAENDGSVELAGSRTSWIRPSARDPSAAAFLFDDDGGGGRAPFSLFAAGPDPCSFGWMPPPFREDDDDCCDVVDDDVASRKTDRREWKSLLDMMQTRCRSRDERMDE